MAELEKKTSRPLHVEDADVESVFDANTPAKDGNTTSVMGTVKLTEGTIIYIPAPTADPQGKPLTVSQSPRMGTDEPSRPP